MKLTAEQRIERTHVRLMQSERFCQFSGVFMVGKVSVDDKHPSAYTNGRDVAYGRSFVEMLSDKGLAFLVVHEAMHKAYRHLTTWSDIAKINRKIANAAMDYVINLQIAEADPYEEDVAMPRDPETGNLIGLLDRRFAGMDTKQVFNILMEEAEEGGGGKGDDEGGERGQDDGGSPSPGGGDDEGSVLGLPGRGDGAEGLELPAAEGHASTASDTAAPTSSAHCSTTAFPRAPTRQESGARS